MNRYFRVGLLGGLLLGQVACLQQQNMASKEGDKEKPALEIPAPLYLGEVHQVYASRQFALLRIIGPIPVEGTVLITHPADGSTERIANLLVSSSQHVSNNIIAADIRAGHVMQGDRVFLYRSISEASNENDKQQEDETPMEEEQPEEPADTPFAPGITGEEPAPYHPISPYTEAADTEPHSDSAPAEATTPPPEPPSVPADSISPKLDDIPDTLDDWGNM